MCCSVLQSVAECCSVLQCVEVCCSVSRCVAVCCSVSQRVAVCCSMLQCVAVCCSMLQCVAVGCSVLQYVAVCCSVFQRVSPALQAPSQTFPKVIPTMFSHTSEQCLTFSKYCAQNAQNIPLIATETYCECLTFPKSHSYNIFPYIRAMSHLFLQNIAHKRPKTPPPLQLGRIANLALSPTPLMMSPLTTFLDGYCSTVQGVLEWFEVDLGFTELLFID